MSKNNNEIKLSEEEAVKMIIDLDQIIVSFDKIKSHFADESDAQKQDKALSDYIVSEKVNQTLAQIKALLSSKFRLKMGEDAMDDLEKACSTNQYWFPENERTVELSSNLENWHKENLRALTYSLINDFNFLYKLLTKKKQNIYAFALVLDDDCITAYSVVSTIESIKKIHKNKEWDAPEWCWVVEENVVKDGLKNFIELLLKHYWDDIAPLFKQGFDYASERQKNLQLFTDAMCIAKHELVKKYGHVVEEMAFYISIPGEPMVEKNSALAINNKDNRKVAELLNSLYLQSGIS